MSDIAAPARGDAKAAISSDALGQRASGSASTSQKGDQSSTVASVFLFPGVSKIDHLLNNTKRMFNHL